MPLVDSLDRLYEKVQELATRKDRFLFLILIFTFITLINGVGIVPEEPYQRLSQNPFTTRTDIHFHNYWQETVFLPVVAHYLGLTGTITFNALTFVLIAGGYFLFAFLAFRRWKTAFPLIASALLITSPLTTILLTWLGTPDGLTVALTIPFLFTNSSAMLFLLAILGAANHPAFIVAVMEILLLRWAARDNIRFKHVFAAVIGVLGGTWIVRTFLHTNGIEVVSRFDFLQLRTTSEWLQMNLSNLPVTLFSLFNTHWLVLSICVIMYFKRDRRFFGLVFLFLWVNYGVVFFTLDTTRVFILTSWAVLFLCMFRSYELVISETGGGQPQQKQYLQALTLIGILSIFAPRIFSWVGEIHVSPFYNIIGYFLRSS